jgi:hypothetical protein
LRKCIFCNFSEFFSLLTCCLFAEISIKIEPLTRRKIKQFPEYKKIEAVHKGFQKHLVYCSGNIYDRVISYEITRPIFETNNVDIGVLLNNPEEFPAGIISAKNFFPGEKIIINFKTAEASFEQKKELIPFPLKVESWFKKFSIDLELISYKPTTTYRVHLHGFKEGEKLKMISKCGKEEFFHNLQYSSVQPIVYSPGVKNLEGGIAKLSFTSKSGTMSIDVPWGSRLMVDLLKS